LVQNAVTGILSLNYQGETRAVCDDHFDETGAQVACLELHGDPTVIEYSHGHACDYDNFWTDDIICNGNEDRISDCQHTAWGNHNCDHTSECIQLYCAAGGPQIDVEGTGRVSVSENNIL